MHVYMIPKIENETNRKWKGGVGAGAFILRHWSWDFCFRHFVVRSSASFVVTKRYVWQRFLVM